VGFQMIRKNDETIVLSNGVLARDFYTRLRGLIGRTELNRGEGMLFPKCNSVHMWMMKIPIDVIFLTRNGEEWKIAALHPSVKPWKFLPIACMKASDTLELSSGAIEELGLEKGQTLCIVS